LKAIVAGHALYKLSLKYKWENMTTETLE
jgi:hypothetical protein